MSDVFYLPQDAWAPAGKDIAPNVERGKSFDLQESAGTDLWFELKDAMRAHGMSEYMREHGDKYGSEYMQRGRLGQGAFRSLFLDAYGRHCALTGESTVPVLEAAHIRPFAGDGDHRISNGLLLRSDFHKLFDVGLVTVEPDYRVRISSRIRDQWFNGKAYYRLDGKELASLPQRPQDRPDPEALRWHNDNRFLA